MLTTAAVQAQQTPALPGGASSQQEIYQDWRVACQVVTNVKSCVLTQQQYQQDGRRVLAIELAAPGGDTVAGTLVLPLGLALDAGVILQIDEKPAMPPMRLRTCVPAGCLVDVGFDAPTLAALRGGVALKVKATADGGAAMSLSVSLRDFGAAFDRVAALAR